MEDFLGEGGGVEAVGAFRVVVGDHAVLCGIGDEGVFAFAAVGGKALIAMALLGHEVGNAAAAIEEDQVEACFGALHDTEDVLETGAAFFELVFELSVEIGGEDVVAIINLCPMA